MAMQLRSGRRLASPAVPVPAPQGDLRRVRPRRSQDDDGGGDDDGTISRLPKEMRLEVLSRLHCTREAMRTSVLSDPWRRLWTELRDLTFDGVAVADLDWLLSAIAQVQPNLDRLSIGIPGKLAGASAISSLLRAADKLEPLELVVRLCKPRSAAAFVLPCFARATSVYLRIPGMRFRLPPAAAGSFASLQQLTLLAAAGGFIDPGVLLPRCPRLRSLVMDGSCPRGGVRAALAIESSSLNELDWHLHAIKQPVDVHVVAPNLKRFVFSSSSSRKFMVTMSLSAPKLEELCLECSLEDSVVGYDENKQWRLFELKLEMGPGKWMEWSDGDGRKHVLSLYIHNVNVSSLVERSFEQEVARLPETLTHFSALELHLQTKGHVFGTFLLQLLRIRTTIQRLKIVLVGMGMVPECWEHCGCDFASNWRNELISLPRLEVAEFEAFRGDDHEMDFLKLLFGSAPKLKMMRVKHLNKISVVWGACQRLHNMFSANASVKFSFS